MIRIPERVDRKQIDKLRFLGDPQAGEVLAALVDLFERDSPARIAALRNAVDAGDATALQRAAHALKGSSANLGAKALAALCGEVIELARRGRMDETSPLVVRIEKEYGAVLHELRGLLQEGKSVRGEGERKR